MFTCLLCVVCKNKHRSMKQKKGGSAANDDDDGDVSEDEVEIKKGQIVLKLVLFGELPAFLLLNAPSIAVIDFSTQLFICIQKEPLSFRVP